jgi:hypothetical protein
MIEQSERTDAASVYAAKNQTQVLVGAKVKLFLLVF